MSELQKATLRTIDSKGKEGVAVNRAPFLEATMKMHNGPDATWYKATYDMLHALK